MWRMEKKQKINKKHAGNGKKTNKWKKKKIILGNKNEKEQKQKKKNVENGKKTKKKEKNIREWKKMQNKKHARKATLLFPCVLEYC